MTDLERSVQAIIAAKNITIASHINPDGDSIGSLLSLGLGLKNAGKRVYMVSADGVPKRYVSLPGAGSIIKDTDKRIDLAISVDCSNKELLGPAYGIFKRAKQVLEIDHHEFRRPFGSLSLIDTKAAAVAELVYILLQELQVTINQDIAQNLLTSIIVETDSFRLPNVRALTFQVCAGLIEKGVDFYRLVDTVFWSRTREAILLSGICFTRCRFLKGGRLAWSIVRKRDFDSVRGRDEDVDAVADEIRSIKGVQIAVLFREKGKNYLRVSLRSKGKINVAGIAEYYGGGGHFDVAGCSIPNNPKVIHEFLGKAEDLL